MRISAAAPILAVLCGLALGAQAAPRDTIIIGQQQEPTVLDPTADATAAIDLMMTRSVFETLVTVDETGRILPALAERWDVEEEGLAYRFALTDKARFTDGTKLDATTVKYSFDRAMAPDSTNPTKSIFAAIEAVQVIDDRTILIKLKRRDSFFLFSMANGDAAIVAPASAATNKTNPVGSGPFKLKEWVRGDRLVLERNPDHRNAAKIALKEVTFRFISDPTAAVAAVKAGEVDAFPTLPAPESLREFDKSPRYKVVVGTTEGEVILALNNARKPFDDIRVRRAISHAIDRRAVIDGAMYGYGTPIGSHFAPHNPAYIDMTGRYPYDPAKAKALLAEAGLAGGFEASVQLPPFPYARRSGEVLQALLGEVGIKLKIQNVEWAHWIGEVYGKAQYDTTIIAHTAPNDFDNYARGKKYFYGYENADYTKLVERIRGETDLAQRTRLLQDAQRFIAEEAVHAFLFQLPTTGVYNAKLQGYWVNQPIQVAPLDGIFWTE